MRLKERSKKAIQHPGEAINFFWHRAFALLGHQHYKRFVVVGGQRTGSTLLVSFLNSHWNIYAKGEIFHRLRGRDYREILNRIFCRQPPNIKAVGFKIFDGQPYDDKESEIWNELIDMPQLHVIHIKRRNMLRTWLSRKISNRTKIWNPGKGSSRLDIQSRRVEFGYNELSRKFQKLKSVEEDFHDKFRSHPMLTVCYEDLISRPDAEFQNITNFLDIPFQRPKTSYMKMNPEKLSTLIANYEFLKKEFSGTEWAHFFEEQDIASVEL